MSIIWNPAKLAALEKAMEKRVQDGCADEREREVAEALGYWMYELKACKSEPVK